MRKLLFSAAPAWLALCWASTPPTLAQVFLVDAASPAAKYIYNFSGNIQVRFGASGVLTPGDYSYAGLPLPGTSVFGGTSSLTLGSSGAWRFFAFSSPSVGTAWDLTPSVPQLPVPGTNVVYDNVTISSGRFGPPEPGFPPPVTTTIPGSATLTITQATPPSVVPAPGTLLLIICGLAGLGLLAPKLRTT